MKIKTGFPEVAKKKAEIEKPDEDLIVEEDIEVIPDVPVAAAPGAAPARKALGVKEVIPFRWKLIGKSSGFTITLFKAVEREDVEAQLERLQKEGYYTELQIVDNNMKIEQTKAARAAIKAASPVPSRDKDSDKGRYRKSAAPPSKPAPAPSAKSAASTPSRSVPRKKTPARTSPPTDRKAAAKPSRPSAAPAARKKAAPSKPAKKTARKS